MATLTVAGVLDGAAEFLSGPGKWIQGDFVSYIDGQTAQCRCAAGGIALVVAPDDPIGNPCDLRGSFDRTELASRSADFFAEFLRDHRDAVPQWRPSGDDEDGGDLDVIETIATWNDDPRRKQSEVVSALRDAAADWRSRIKRTAA